MTMEPIVVDVNDPESVEAAAKRAAGLFDRERYRVPFPKQDGKDVTRFVLALGGQIEYNRHDKSHAEMFEGMKLGGFGYARISYALTGRTVQVKIDAKENEVVTYAVAAKVLSFDLGESDVETEPEEGDDAA